MPSDVDELEAGVGTKDVALAGDARPIAEGLHDLIGTMRERSHRSPIAPCTCELLAAIRESTILASSLADLHGIELDPQAVAAGARHARAVGFARAAFLVRVGQTIAGKDRSAVTSCLLGALADLDLQLIETRACRRSRTRRVVRSYGYAGACLTRSPDQ